MEWLIARVNAQTVAETVKQTSAALRQIMAEESYARIIEHEGGKYKVLIYASTNPDLIGKTRQLVRSEIMGPSAEIGVCGKLVLKDAGMYVSYHLIPI
jgi:hypothetical protein